MEPYLQPSKTHRTIGWILSGLVILFLLFDGIGKLVQPDEVIKATVELGYPETVLTGLGVVLLISTLLYVFPKTSLTGAVLLTAYLGGAVATHVRLEQPWFSHTLFPVYVGIVLWAGLLLRRPALKNQFCLSTKIK